MANDLHDALHASVPALAETSGHLANAAPTLAISAAPLLRQPVTAGAVPPAAARSAPAISTAAVPLARAAPMVADSVPLLAPLLKQ